MDTESFHCIPHVRMLKGGLLLSGEGGRARYMEHYLYLFLAD